MMYYTCTWNMYVHGDDRDSGVRSCRASIVEMPNAGSDLKSLKHGILMPEQGTRLNLALLDLAPFPNSCPTHCVSLRLVSQKKKRQTSNRLIPRIKCTRYLESFTVSMDSANTDKQREEKWKKKRRLKKKEEKE